MRRTPMPPRSVPLLRTATLPSGSPLARTSQLPRSSRLKVVRADGAAPAPVRRQQQRKNTIPDDVLKQVDVRDGHYCVHCGRRREVIEHHHRRIKGMGGSTAAHTECACNIVSVCPWWTESACHPWAHRNRDEAEAEGLVISRSTEFPFLVPVFVHGRDDAGSEKAWPTCGGRWVRHIPEGSAA